ncbi:hypothetical protein ABZP36_020864 [Zizania latifolia]
MHVDRGLRELVGCLRKSEKRVIVAGGGSGTSPASATHVPSGTRCRAQHFPLVHHVVRVVKLDAAGGDDARGGGGTGGVGGVGGRARSTEDEEIGGTSVSRQMIMDGGYGGAARL